MHRAVSAVAALVIAGALAGGILAAPALAQPSTAVPNCSESFDSYSYTQQAVQDCGYQTSTSRTEESEPEGGSAYVYTFSGGSTATIYEPPAGIDWVDASAAVRADYGIPEAPPASDGIPAAENWQTLLEHMTTPAPAPAFLAVMPNSSDPTSVSDTGDSGNWSGYVAYPSSKVTSVYIDYTEPTVSQCKSDATASFWAGIGGIDSSHASGNNDLGQDGTAYGDTGLSNGQAWWEIVPKPSGVKGGMIPLNLKIASTLPVYAGVQYSGGTYSGFVDSYQTGDYQSWSHSGAYSGKSGEAIAERTETASDYYTPLSHYSGLTYSDVQVNNEYMNDYNPDGHRTGLHMYDLEGTQLSNPGDVGADGTFSPTWEACGTLDKASDF